MPGLAQAMGHFDDVTSKDILRQAVLEAFAPAAQEAYKGFYQDTIKSNSTLKDAAVSMATPSPAPSPAKKPPAQPTGIRPRIFLLTSMVFLAAVVPVVGLFLPIYYVAGQQRDDEANKRQIACVLFPTPISVLSATTSTSPGNASIVSSYLSQLKNNCTQV